MIGDGKALAASEARESVLREQVEFLRSELAKKDEVIQAMVREGYRPDLAPPMPEMEMPNLPGRVMAAIEEIADPGTTLYADLVAQAEMELKDDEMTAEMVADGIRTGGDFNPYT